MTSPSSKPDPMEEPAVIAYDLYEMERRRAEAAANHLARAWEAIGMSGYDHRTDVITVEDAVIAMDADLKRMRAAAKKAVKSARNHRSEAIHYEALAEILGVVL